MKLPRDQCHPRLEDILQTELDLARRRQQRCDSACGGIAYLSIRRTEVRCVKRIEEFGTKIEPIRFSYPKRSRYYEIKIGIARSP